MYGLHWQCNNAADVVTLTALAFVTKMTETCKSTVPNAIQEIKMVKKIHIEETLKVKSRLKKVNKLLTYAIMLESLITVYV